MICKSQESAIYSIISLSGSIETINRIARRSCEMFEGEVLSGESFYEWYQIDENRNRLLNFLVNLYNERSECLFTIYLSDHDYSRFVFYMYTFCSMNDNTSKEVIRNIDVLYQNFDKSLLQPFNNDMDKGKLVELNSHSLMLLKSILPNEYSNTIRSAKNSLEGQMESILGANKALCVDLSIVDFLHYSASLINLANEYAISTICASEHSAKKANICITHLVENSDDIKFNYQVITDFRENPIGILLKNLSIICDFVWNQLHVLENIDKLCKQDKLIISYLWLLFQSKYSSWIITNVDFAKIKQILEDIKEQND